MSVINRPDGKVQRHLSQSVRETSTLLKPTQRLF